MNSRRISFISISDKSNLFILVEFKLISNLIYKYNMYTRYIHITDVLNQYFDIESVLSSNSQSIRRRAKRSHGDCRQLATVSLSA